MGRKRDDDQQDPLATEEESASGLSERKLLPQHFEIVGLLDLRGNPSEGSLESLTRILNARHVHVTLRFQLVDVQEFGELNDAGDD